MYGYVTDSPKACCVSSIINITRFCFPEGEKSFSFLPNIDIFFFKHYSLIIGFQNKQFIDSDKVLILI